MRSEAKNVAQIRREAKTFGNENTAADLLASFSGAASKVLKLGSPEVFRDLIRRTKMLPKRTGSDAGFKGFVKLYTEERPEQTGLPLPFRAQNLQHSCSVTDRRDEMTNDGQHIAWKKPLRMQKLSERALKTAVARKATVRLGY
ncbi:hypothetical protein HPB52_001324 [Rhipicephalus sanguineus]|uniref:Uncharacterized protein n=1 Tax=Rhipicephalus sanguineus TaxID=34632 RepID=A0A9D4STE2_RHISA|nr:hypothetical protein HPB52_001324 [Rhipicephalus sanguineus]